jgi:hypothetical protein
MKGVGEGPGVLVGIASGEIFKYWGVPVTGGQIEGAFPQADRTNKTMQRPTKNCVLNINS